MLTESVKEAKQICLHIWVTSEATLPNLIITFSKVEINGNPSQANILSICVSPRWLADLGLVQLEDTSHHLFHGEN